MPDLQTTLLIVIAVSVASKQTLSILIGLAKFFPGIALFVPALEKLLKNGNVKEEVPAWAQQLQEHYNDTTTHVLTDIRDGVNKTNTILENVEMCKK